jgi:membrane-associated phospholipid phosphatase
MIAVALALAVTATDKVDVRPAADLAIGGVALIVYALPELLKNELAPAHCHLCDGADNTGLPGTGSSSSLNGVDAWFHDATAGWLVSRRTADVASSVWAYALVPLGVAAGAFTTTGPYATDGAGWRAMAIIEESAVVSAAVVQGLKYALARKRPFVRYGTGETSGSYDVGDADSRASLPSGHTTFVTSLGFALATTATIQESQAAPWLWGAAAVGSVTTGALRMMAEKHYFTDVAAGFAVGAACGVVFPLLHRRGGPLSSTGTLSIAPQGPGFALSGRF